ncbi:F-box protein PP2-B7 [Nymphaea thermarum]|nr:F-box protein PP2-B7 [Nymphaea thermarum]
MASNPPRSSASIADLPENCVSHVLSLMSPREVFRSSAIPTSFQSAANSDYVLEKVLPPALPELLSRAVSPVCFSSKMELFFRLCSVYYSLHYYDYNHVHVQLVTKEKVVMIRKVMTILAEVHIRKEKVVVDG